MVASVRKGNESASVPRVGEDGRAVHFVAELRGRPTIPTSEGSISGDKTAASAVSAAVGLKVLFSLRRQLGSTGLRFPASQWIAAVEGELLLQARYTLGPLVFSRF
jgi:hypothetical protein